MFTHACVSGSARGVGGAVTVEVEHVADELLELELGDEPAPVLVRDLERAGHPRRVQPRPELRRRVP